MAAFLPPLRLALAAGKGLALMHLVANHGFVVSPATGPSMLPSLEVYGELILISRLHRLGRGVGVGDLIAYYLPFEPQAEGIKRVIGMPGDYVLVNSPDSPSETMMQVPEGHCWLVGDNLYASRDSRILGPVPLGLVRGKVIARMWPLWRPRWIENTLKPVKSP